MEAHVTAAALNAKSMFSVKHLLDLHHHSLDAIAVASAGNGIGNGGSSSVVRQQSTGGTSTTLDAISKLQMSAASSSLAAPNYGGAALLASAGGLRDDPTSSTVTALFPAELQLTSGGGPGAVQNDGSSISPSTGYGDVPPDLAQAAAAAMAPCYGDQELNPYTRWLQSNASLDYYTGRSVNLAALIYAFISL